MRLLTCLITMLFSVSVAFANEPERRIALTFDDIPRQRGAFLAPDERTEKLVATLKAAGVEQAAFFVNPGRLSNPDGAGGEARIATYVAAGHVIANHSFNHKRLSEVTAEEYLTDIDATEAWLK
ncbi:MAG TPA: polysaccharide deacetylase family protein, partial [Sphingorhabdus lacus]|nr:polysaccharide deacetylase family protein [Sphingorhabdus lacus]